MSQYIGCANSSNQGLHNYVEYYALASYSEVLLT